MSELSNVYSSHHDDPSGATESQDAAAEANPSSQRQDPRHLPVKPWANGTGKGNTCQLYGAISNDKGEITGTSKSIQRKLDVDEAKRLLEEAHVEVQAAQNKVTEPAFRVGISQIRKLLEANSEPVGQ